MWNPKENKLWEITNFITMMLRSFQTNKKTFYWESVICRVMWQVLSYISFSQSHEVGITITVMSEEIQTLTASIWA